jgi:3-oxoacyl-[acyl-carrier protein] reductase
MVLETGLRGAHMIITGGTRGMGKVMVESFLLEGTNVSYCARTVSGQEFANFKGAHGALAVGTAVDVGSKDVIEDWVKKSGERFGRIDTVIANGKQFIPGQCPTSSLPH